MKNKVMLKVVLASSLLFSCSAFAQDAGKAYVRADAGYAMLGKNPNKTEYSKKPSGSPVYGVGFGYKFTDHLRSDVTVTHRSNFKYSALNSNEDKEKQKISSTAFMLNGYYDLFKYKGFTPYVMLGAGIAYNKAGKFQIDDIAIKGTQKSSFAWQAGFGTQYKITKNLSLDAGYRYISLGKMSTTNEAHYNGRVYIDSATKGKLRSHELLCGISYSF